MIELIARITLQFHCYYNEWPIIENRLKELDAIIENQEFDAEGVKVSVAITKDNSVILQKNISDITRGRVNITL